MGILTGLTDWPTEGRLVQYLSEYVLWCKKGTLKNPGEIFLKISQIIFEKNAVAEWKRIGLNLLYHFWNWMEYSVQNDNVQFFDYMNSNCVFSKTIWKTLQPNGDWQTDGNDETDVLTGLTKKDSKNPGNIYRKSRTNILPLPRSLKKTLS